MNSERKLHPDDEAALALAALAHPEYLAQIETIRDLMAQANVPTGPPLSHEALLTWERQHGCTLPLAYRLFLQLVGNGVYNAVLCPLFPLLTGETASSQNRIIDVSRSFLLTQRWHVDSDGSPESVLPSDDVEWDSSHPLGRAIVEARRMASEGCLVLQGDTNDDAIDDAYYLVVNGVNTGQVWTVSVEGDSTLR